MKHLGKITLTALLVTAINIPAYATSSNSGGGTNTSGAAVSSSSGGFGSNTDRSSRFGSNTDRGSNVGANTDRRSGSINTNDTTGTSNRPGNVDVDTSGAARTDVLNRGNTASGTVGAGASVNTNAGTASTNTQAGLDFEGYRAFTGTNSAARRGELERSFKQLDKNNDSRLSDEELRAGHPNGR